MKIIRPFLFLFLFLVATGAAFSQSRAPLIVIVDQGPAIVMLDGRRLGTANPEFRAQVNQGSYELTVRFRDRPDFVQFINVGPSGLTVNTAAGASAPAPTGKPSPSSPSQQPAPAPQPAPRPAPTPQPAPQPAPAPPPTAPSPGIPGAVTLNFSGYLDQNNLQMSHTFEVSREGDFIFTLTTSDTLNLEGAGLRVMDSDGRTRLLAANHGSGTTKTYEVNALLPGYYTLEVQKDGRPMYSGSYSVAAQVRFASILTDREPNNSFQQAANLSLNSRVSGLLGFRGQGRQADMQDWYKVTLPQRGKLSLALTTSGSSGIRPTDGNLNLRGGTGVYDSTGTNRVRSFPHGSSVENTYTTSDLEPGTYYILLEKDSTPSYWGSYTLMVTMEGAPVAADPPATAPPAASTPGVSRIEIGSGVDAVVGPRDSGTEHAYFTFTIPSTGTYRVLIKEEGHGGGFLLHVFRDASFTNEVDPLQGRNNTDFHPAGGQIHARNYTLPAGTYYLKVSNRRPNMTFPINVTVYSYNTAWDNERG